MALTLEQVQARLQAAWESFNLGESSYTIQGRTVQFHGIAELQRHIDWLMKLEERLTEQASAAAGDATSYSPVVRFQGPQL